MTITDEPAQDAGPSVSPGPPVAAIIDQLVTILAVRRRCVAEHCLANAISMMHLYLLGVLDSGASIPMSRVADLIGVSLPSATGIVGRMEERGLVQRVHDLRDRRLVLVQLTDEGRRAAQSMEAADRADLATALDELSPGERATLLAGIRLYADAARRHAERSGVGAHPMSRHPRTSAAHNEEETSRTCQTPLP